MTRRSAGVWRSARAQKRPPKPQPTITIRAGVAPNKGPRSRGIAEDVGAIMGYSRAGSSGPAAEAADPLLAQRQRLGRAEDARLKAPGEPQAIHERGEPDRRQAQILRAGTRAAPSARRLWHRLLLKQLSEQAMHQLHVGVVGLALYALDGARVAVQPPEHHPHRQHVGVEV